MFGSSALTRRAWPESPLWQVACRIGNRHGVAASGPAPPVRTKEAHRGGRTVPKSGLRIPSTAQRFPVERGHPIRVRTDAQAGSVLRNTATAEFGRCRIRCPLLSSSIASFLRQFVRWRQNKPGTTCGRPALRHADSLWLRQDTVGGVLIRTLAVGFCLRAAPLSGCLSARRSSRNHRGRPSKTTRRSTAPV